MPAVQLHEIQVTAAELADAAQWAHASGIQAWSFDAEGVARLRKYNALQAPRAGWSVPPATAAGTVPVYSVPVKANGVPHRADAERLLAWLESWPDTVHTVDIHTPRDGLRAKLPRLLLINALRTAHRVATVNAAH